MVYYAPRDPVDHPPPNDDEPSRASRMGFGPSYMPNLITALVASVAVFAGSLGPWVIFLALNASGFDINLNSGWGGTLTIGGVSAFALFTQLNVGRSGRTPWLMVVVTGLIPLIAATSFIIALIFIIRVRSAPSLELFGTPLGAQVGWGLWAVAAGSAVLCLTSWVVASQVCDSVETTARLARGLADLYIALVTVALLGLGFYTFQSWDRITAKDSRHVLNLAPLTRSPATAPGSSQPPTSGTPAITTPPGTTQGALLKEMGERAAFVGPDGPLLDFAVTNISTNSCTSTHADPPVNGTFVVIDIAARTHADPIVTNWSGTFDAANWQAVGPDGYTEPHVDTSNGYMCSRQHPPDRFAVNSKYWFQIVLDTRYSTGKVLFQPLPEKGGWEWAIPE